LKRLVILGGALMALLVSGCDTLSGVAGEFQPAATVEVAGVLDGACVRLVATSDGRTVGTWTGCTVPYTFRVNLPNGTYTLTGQAGREGLVYQEGRLTTVVQRGGRTTLPLSRKRVNVQVTAAWLDNTRAAIAEAWALPQEAQGVPTYSDTPPNELRGRVLVAREVVVQGTGSLNVPTGRDVAFRLAQGETQGITRVSRLEVDGKVVVP